jgi:ribonuclease HI
MVLGFAIVLLYGCLMKKRESQGQTEFAASPSCAVLEIQSTKSTATESLTVVFDGGAKPNLCYGSFAVVEWPDRPIERREFEGYSTNNEAEMLTAIQALRFLNLVTPSPKSVAVKLKGDSMLAVNCLSGRWKIRQPRLQAIAHQFREIADYFHSVSFEWHSRNNSVSILGH